ncbi:hypothetical protein CVS40_5610, partial [Lucilia cuprina]
VFIFVSRENYFKTKNYIIDRKFQREFLSTKFPEHLLKNKQLLTKWKLFVEDLSNSPAIDCVVCVISPQKKRHQVQVFCTERSAALLCLMAKINKISQTFWCSSIHYPLMSTIIKTDIDKCSSKQKTIIAEKMMSC